MQPPDLKSPCSRLDKKAKQSHYLQINIYCFTQIFTSGRALQ